MLIRPMVNRSVEICPMVNLSGGELSDGKLLGGKLSGGELSPTCDGPDAEATEKALRPINLSPSDRP